MSTFRLYPNFHWIVVDFARLVAYRVIVIHIVWSPSLLGMSRAKKVDIGGPIPRNTNKRE